jgi:hypothetical protein
MKVSCSSSTGSSAVGRFTASRPRITTFPGISMMTPRDTLMSVGVPHPSFAMGPIRNLPLTGGKIARRSLRMRGAFSMMLVGKRIPLTAPVRTPSASGSSSTARLRPSSPPTPMSVKP